MNVLFFTSREKPIDGWGSVGYNIVKELRKKNVNVEVFSGENKSKRFFDKSSLKSELYGRFKYLTLIHDIISVFYHIERKPDLIHCNVEYYAPLAMILASYYKIPYTVTAHGTYAVLLPKKYKLYKKAFEKANKVICVSNYTKKRMIEEGIKANYEVIFNGVDKNIFKPNKEVEKEDIITFVGNLKSRKGLLFLLETMEKVSKVNPNIKVIVIGKIDFQSERYKKISEYIKRKNLNVEFVGSVSEDELVKYYQRAKLNILPSKTDPYFFEGFGLVHLEANACGTLTVGTRNSGNEDAILKGNGFLVEYGDVESLKKIILDVFSYKEYPNINIDDVLDWTEVANKYKILFENLIYKNK